MRWEGCVVEHRNYVSANNRGEIQASMVGESEEEEWWTIPGALWPESSEAKPGMMFNVEVTGSHFDLEISQGNQWTAGDIEAIDREVEDLAKALGITLKEKP